jgi:hypothetical protein
MSSRIFSVTLLMLGRAEHLSCSTDTQPTLKREYHSKTSVWLKEYSPKASQSISRVSVMHLSSFKQNLMQAHCLILPSIADTKHEVKKALL